MKKLNLKIVGVFIFSTLTFTCFAQNWRLGGNTVFPFGGINSVNATNNIMGTVAGANFPLRVVTNGIQRMHINQNTGLTNGFIGMGNGFNNPQSHLHINNPTNQETWMQITNNATGLTTIDGLRFGIFDNNSGLAVPNSYIRWHERSPIIFQTLGSTMFGNEINNGERLRISAIGDGSPEPFNVQGNETRVSISHNGIGGDPITRIRSLLHIGYNTGAIAGNLNLNDGWRNWMDVGTFTSVGREHMYVGFKQEVEGGVIGLLPEDSHYEAIINWGDNEIAGAGERNTNLRFVYTTPQIGTFNVPQSQVDGLETMRIEPTVASTLSAPNFGMVGIGNFSSTGPNTANPDVVNAKLDIDGDLRIRTVTQDNTLTRVLVVDPNDHNRVHWRDAANLTPNVTSDNGIFVNTAGVVQLGVPCLDVNGNINTVGILATQFTEDRVIANRDFNFWIGSLDTETGGVGFGGQPASTAFCNTGNTVEISANNKNTKYGNANASGLRFTKLTSTSLPLANGTNGVNNTRALTVDQDGVWCS